MPNRGDESSRACDQQEGERGGGREPDREGGAEPRPPPQVSPRVQRRTEAEDRGSEGARDQPRSSRPARTDLLPRRLGPRPDPQSLEAPTTAVWNHVPLHLAHPSGHAKVYSHYV